MCACVCTCVWGGSGCGGGEPRVLVWMLLLSSPYSEMRIAAPTLSGGLNTKLGPVYSALSVAWHCGAAPLLLPRSVGPPILSPVAVIWEELVQAQHFLTVGEEASDTGLAHLSCSIGPSVLPPSPDTCPSQGVCCASQDVNPPLLSCALICEPFIGTTLLIQHP